MLNANTNILWIVLAALHTKIEAFLGGPRGFPRAVAVMVGFSNEMSGNPGSGEHPGHLSNAVGASDHGDGPSEPCDNPL
jgi:hypothetical protein